jgi:hypothetical protein
MRAGIILVASGLIFILSSVILFLLAFIMKEKTALVRFWFLVFFIGAILVLAGLQIGID